jgi:hypothetical protein
MADEAKLERRREQTRMRVQRYRTRKRLATRPFPRLYVVAADPPDLLDRLPREVLSPHALRGPIGETAAKVYRAKLFESDAKAKRHISDVSESEDAPTARRPTLRDLESEDAAAKTAHARHFESEAEGGQAKALGVSKDTVRRDMAQNAPQKARNTNKNSSGLAQNAPKSDAKCATKPAPKPKPSRKNSAKSAEKFRTRTPEPGETAKGNKYCFSESEDAAAKANKCSPFESDETEDFEDEPDPVEEEFQRQLAELRKHNARVYANPTPWPLKK